MASMRTGRRGCGVLTLFRQAMDRRRGAVLVAATLVLGMLGGCSTVVDHPELNASSKVNDMASPLYRIGPGDNVRIFVWRNADLSNSVPVRPDGKITTPLVEDLQAAGKTPTELARDVEAVLSTYIKSPVVTIIVTGFSGPFSDQIRVLGEASQPRALAYQENMTLLDVMIQVGGLTDFADGNSAVLVRRVPVTDEAAADSVTAPTVQDMARDENGNPGSAEADAAAAPDNSSPENLATENAATEAAAVESASMEPGVSANVAAAGSEPAESAPVAQEAVEPAAAEQAAPEGSMAEDGVQAGMSISESDATAHPATRYVEKQYVVRLEDLIKRGDISANARVLPGDVLIIPEALF